MDVKFVGVQKKQLKYKKKSTKIFNERAKSKVIYILGNSFKFILALNINMSNMFFFGRMAVESGSNQM